MSAITESSPSPAAPTLSGDTRRDVSGLYARRVLVPGVLALLLTPMFGPLSILLADVSYRLVSDYELWNDVANYLNLAELVAGGVLYVVAFLRTVQLGRRYREDRSQHVANGTRPWHVGSITLLVLLTAIPILLVFVLIALVLALSAVSSGL